MVIKLGYFGVGPWISDKEDCADENAEIKIEVIENDIEPKTEPEFIDLQMTEKSYQVCTFNNNLSELEGFQFRWLRIKGFCAACPISITLFFHHLKKKK